MADQPVPSLDIINSHEGFGAAEIKPGLDELMEYYRVHYVRNAVLADRAGEVLQ